MPHIEDMRNYMSVSRQDEINMLVEDTDVNFEEEIIEESLENAFTLLEMDDSEFALIANQILINEYELWSEVVEPNCVRVATEDLDYFDASELPGFNTMITEGFVEESPTERKYNELVENLKDLVQRWTYLKEDTGHPDVDSGVQDGFIRAATELEDLLKKEERDDS